MLILIVHTMDIKAQSSGSHKPDKVFLRFFLCEMQVWLTRNNPQNILSQRQIVPEQDSHECIVNGTESAKSL